MPVSRKIWKRLATWAAILAGIILIFIIFFRLTIRLDNPVHLNKNFNLPERKMVNPDLYTLGNNWLHKSRSGLWEMYIEGKPFERGVANGVLSRDLIFIQEEAFVKQIRKMVPSEFYLRFLKYLTYWFDRKIDHYIPEEYLKEIYGISLSAADQYDFIGKKYDRILNYHAAHDIGHAMQNYHLVGCTSFGVWGHKTADSMMIIGRNFDFYVGDDFARNKVVCFFKPDQGYKFMFISWGAMMGVVSGMNEKGITVTINAAKSDIPRSAAEPVSIIVREVLQYASNISEAYEIVKKRKSFVSESFLVGSTSDKRVVIIEKSPVKTDLYTPDGDQIICTNHFQSAAFKSDQLNLDNIRESASMYRYNRVQELLGGYASLNVKDVANILRDQRGMGNTDIGMGNEKAINQLIAHHSVIFEPEKLLVWVSTYPFQVGNYVCYDLNKVFNLQGNFPGGEIYETANTIPPDTMMFSPLFNNYRLYKIQTAYLKNHSEKIHLQEDQIRSYILLNPGYYEAYATIAEYFKNNSEIAPAIKYYQQALMKEIPDMKTREGLIKSMNSCLEKHNLK